ncbi:YihY/virulence factor BrkB family protein [Oceanicola sp. 22II-s10i]|uniref:YihY/virulence factor BrkB family protein n=1 Tax=Oceanicola sp. 22II-s10i TaxID=1317116 RepID=UPI000B528575|nr:YihY/virulence factor BrkB family protein [Oceanicola sp. 22II-s10i]
MTQTNSADRGTAAVHPAGIPARGWKEILWRVKAEIAADHVSVVSAGVAFFGLLATFPAIGALISIAGFFLDPVQVAGQIDALVALLPANAASIIQDQVVKVTGGDEAATGLAALLGIALALYGAMKGVMTLMEGMNIAYEEDETRGFVRLYATAFGLTLLLIAGVIGAILVMMVLPFVVDYLGVGEPLNSVLKVMQWPILAVLAVLGISAIYRIGPSRDRAKWRWISPGAVLATVLWLAGTLGFSAYAQNFSDYNETYGTIGGVIALLTWMWLSAFILLLGAELNAEMERQTVQDTTRGPEMPMGERGARMADVHPPAAGDQPDPEAGPGLGHDGTRDAPRKGLPRTDSKAIAAGLALFAFWQMTRRPRGHGRDTGSGRSPAE